MSLSRLPASAPLLWRSPASPSWSVLAPVQAADKPAAPGTPVLCTSWSEAVEKLGYSDDWATYTLCEFMYSHFKLFACQPVIFCNVLDIATAKEASAATDVAVTEHKVKLPIAAINDSTLVIKPAGGTGSAYVSGTDYNAYYSGEHLVVELLSTGSAYDAEQVNIAYNKVKASTVTASDIASAMENVELCLTLLGHRPRSAVRPRLFSAVYRGRCDDRQGRQHQRPVPRQGADRH